MYDGNHMGAGGWVFMAIVMVVLLGLLAAFIVRLVGDQPRRPHHEGVMAGRPATHDRLGERDHRPPSRDR